MCVKRQFFKACKDKTLLFEFGVLRVPTADRIGLIVPQSSQIMYGSVPAQNLTHLVRLHLLHGHHGQQMSSAARHRIATLRLRVQGVGVCVCVRYVTWIPSTSSRTSANHTQGTIHRLRAAISSTSDTTRKSAIEAASTSQIQANTSPSGGWVPYTVAHLQKRGLRVRGERWDGMP